MGSIVESLPFAGSATQLFAPHRSAIQMLRPSLSMSTALVEPQTLPSGSLKNSLMVVYGFGASLVGGIPVWACTRHPSNATAATIGANRTSFMRTDIAAPLVKVQSEPDYR